MFDRCFIKERVDYINQLESIGMNYHTIDNKPYWNENFYYKIRPEVIDNIESATNELHALCIEYVKNTINSGDYTGYNFDDNTINLIELSWKNNHENIYGRFDFGIGPDYSIKMFEYNADTPTSLLEASVAQWMWKEQVFPEYDQFNSIHEKLVQLWKNVVKTKNLYFTANRTSPLEDWGSLHYLLSTAVEAGIDCSSIDLEAIGWSESNSVFCDTQNKEIQSLFKLYPWEWMVRDDFSKYILKSSTTFYEPAWKMLLSNKLLCVKLWEMCPNHPNLLESHDMGSSTYTPFFDTSKWISKPKLGREGQGVSTFNGIKDVNNIIQNKFNVISFNDGIQPVVGSWVIGNESAGIGIREEKGITTNNSQFVPHYFY